MTERDDNLLDITWLCEAAGVSRSGYYHYLATEDVRSQHEKLDHQSFLIILEAYQFRGYNKGARGILYAAAPYETSYCSKRERKMILRSGLRILVLVSQILIEK